MALQVQVGDVIRAYDFKPMVGRGDCYVEGIVLEVNDNTQGYSAYRIQVVKDVFAGESEFTERLNETMFVPWRVSFMEYDGRVMNLSR